MNEQKIYDELHAYLQKRWDDMPEKTKIVLDLLPDRKGNYSLEKSERIIFLKTVWMSQFWREKYFELTKQIK